jgi:hypothetical protein
VWVCVVPRVVLVVVAPVPSPKFQKYDQVSVREVPAFLSELVSVNVAVSPLVRDVNDASGA